MLINVDDDGNWRGWWCCDVDDDDGDDDVVDGDMIMMMMMMVMMVMLMKMLMMMMMKKITRGRWWCWYWGGGRWRCWGGGCWGGRPIPRSGSTLCASLRSPNVSQKPFCTETYRQNAGPVSRDTHFVRACAVEMHMDMSQEAFCVKKIRENAGRYQYHVDWTPSVWPHCLGKESLGTPKTQGHLIHNSNYRRKNVGPQAKGTWTCHKRHL